MTPLQARVKALQESLFDEVFYTHTWCLTLIEHGLSTYDIEDGTVRDEHLLSVCSEFRQDLPYDTTNDTPCFNELRYILDENHA